MVRPSGDQNNKPGGAARAGQQSSARSPVSNDRTQS